MLTCFETQWASPVFQDNIVFEYDKKIYILDKKIVECTQEIFRFLKGPVQIHKKEILSRLAVLFITPQQTNLIFTFFYSGIISNLLGRKVIQSLSKRTSLFGLSLLDSYLQTRGIEKKPRQVERVSLNDQLILFALQQNLEGFCETLIRLQDTWQSVDLSAIAHFHSASFKTLMVKWIRPRCSALYPSLIEEYCLRRWISLESDLPFFKDEELKFDCLAVCPLLDRRIQWFNIYWEKMAVDLIRKVIIQPLMDMQRLLEAKAWVLKTEDRTSAKLLACEFDKIQSQEIKDLFPLLDKPDLTLYSEENDETMVIGALLQLQRASSRPEIIQRCADQYFCAYMESKSGLAKTFKEILTIHFKNDEPLVWDQEFVSLIVHSFIQASVKYTNEKTVKNFKKAAVDFHPYETYLHPSLPTSCEIIGKLKETLQDIFLKVFKSDEEEQTSMSLNESELINSIQLTVRQCYSQAFSLPNDFIVQFVSTRWLMNMKCDQTKSLIQELEEALKEAEFGELSQKQIELAFFTYLRLAAETANLSFIFQQQQRLNIYDSQHLHMSEIVKLLETIAPKLHEDFPKEIMQKRAPVVAKFLYLKSELKRALMIRSLHTFYTVRPPEQVVYIPFFPS